LSMVGEALVGEGKEIAHIDLVIGGKGGAVESAFMNSLASPQVGHTPLLAVLEPNLPTKPPTLIVNKVTIKNASQAVLMFGPAQAAVAKAVMDSVEEGVIPKDKAEELYIIVSALHHSLRLHRVGRRGQEEDTRLQLRGHEAGDQEGVQERAECIRDTQEEGLG